MTKELKVYEDRYDYTVKGQAFKEGFEDLIVDLSMVSFYSQTIYLNTETGDIDSVASCDFGSMADTYYGINVGILDWEVYGGCTRIFDTFEAYELEEFLNKEELENLKKQFEEEVGYTEDWYEDKEEFYIEHDSDYVNFLLEAGNENIDEGVKAYARDTVDFYIKKFDEAYAALLDNEEF